MSQEPTSARGCDVVALWPDLFDGVDSVTRNSYRQVFASEYLAGWAPERQAVADLLAFERGEIDRDQYLSRGAGRVHAAS